MAKLGVDGAPKSFRAADSHAAELTSDLAGACVLQHRHHHPSGQFGLEPAGPKISARCADAGR